MVTVLIQDINPILGFGILSGLLSVFSYIPYIIDTIRRRTTPQRASWLIWSVLGTIAFFSQIHEGAGPSLWFSGVQISGTLTVFFLSIWIGAGHYLQKTDCMILCVAALGLLAWGFAETAVYALAISISISLIGGSVTVLKAYRDPDSETMSMWLVSFIASIFAALSVGGWNWVLLAYPLYLFTLYGAILGAMVLGRARRRMILPGFLSIE